MTHDTMTFSDAVKYRRSIYGLTKKSTISDQKIHQILQHAIKDVPSSFNSQSSRLVVLLKDQHDKFWDVIESKLKPIVEKQGSDWSKTEARVNMFRNAYGTILFYEDPAVVQKLQQQYPLYADKFGQWSEHTSAMHQFMLWTAFEAEGLGCNLQHYNPLPNKEVSDIWNVPSEWDLKAQLVFGTPQDGARENLGEKSAGQIDGERLFVYGGDEEVKRGN